MEKSLKIWIEGTIVAALAMVLSLIPLGIGSSFSISLGQIPLTLFALRRGVKPGLLAGLIWGLLHFVMGDVYFLSVPQVLIEYPFAFTFAGMAGIYANRVRTASIHDQVKKTQLLIIQGSLVGAISRYFWHFIAGWIFWGDYALWNMSPWTFSLVMNGASGLATAAVTIASLLFIYQMNHTLFAPKTTIS